MLVGWILELVAAAPSDPLFKYKRPALPYPNYFPPSSLSIFSLEILTILYHCKDGIYRIRLSEILQR
jgi:hypothetical protein